MSAENEAIVRRLFKKRTYPVAVIRGTGLKRRAKRFVSVSGKCFPICSKTEHILLLKRLGTLWLGLARARYSKKFS